MLHFAGSCMAKAVLLITQNIMIREMRIDVRVQDVLQQLRTDTCQGNWSVVIAQSTVALFIDWNNVCLFTILRNSGQVVAW